jgi:hypothetical protein
VVKHRQLARQIGAFGGFASESSTDLDNMIFSTGSTFIFGSWICEADDDSKLQGHLLEDSAHHEDLAILTTTTNQLAGRFTQLAMSVPTQISWPTNFDSNSSFTSEMESYLGSFYDGPSSFPLGLHNMPQSIKDSTRDTFRIPSRSRVLSHLDSITWHRLIRHYSKDQPIWCEGCH